jgi:hypothetical protein
MVNRDYRDLFGALNAARVDYMIVGAYAVAVHGHVRATKDLDVWIKPTPENAARLFHALQQFGAPMEGLTESEFSEPGMILQLGFPPVRIDILTSLAGVTFEEAWSTRVHASYGDQQVSVISREHLITNKRAAGRLQDLADVEALESGDTDDE